MTNAGPELPYPCSSEAKTRDKSPRRECAINRYANFQFGGWLS